MLAQYEAREKLIANKSTEYDLQLKLYEAQLAKAKIERAEINTDFTKERLEVIDYLANTDLMNQHNKIPAAAF